MKRKVQFYQRPDGREPVREFLKALDANDRKKVGGAIQRAQDDPTLGMPHVRPLESGLSEIRSPSSRGPIRIFFTLLATPVLVLLHAIFKKSQKTPQHDLELARDRAQEVHAAGRSRNRDDR